MEGNFGRRLSDYLADLSPCLPKAPELKKYPAKHTLTSFTCFFGLIQFLAIAVFVETEFENWKIQYGEELFTILYSGIVASGIVALQRWYIQKSGPVFVAVFQPLLTFLVVVMATLVLADQLYSGGIIGALRIMLGLFSVLWGKNEENRKINQGQVLKKPLLEADIKEDYGIVLDISYALEPEIRY